MIKIIVMFISFTSRGYIGHIDRCSLHCNNFAPLPKGCFIFTLYVIIVFFIPLSDWYSDSRCFAQVSSVCYHPIGFPASREIQLELRQVSALFSFAVCCKCFSFHPRDSTKLNRNIASPTDGQILQDDINALSKWEKDWQMSFNPEKCRTICFSTKKNVVTPFTLNGHALDRYHHHSHLRIILSEDLKWASSQLPFDYVPSYCQQKCWHWKRLNKWLTTWHTKLRSQNLPMLSKHQCSNHTVF